MEKSKKNQKKIELTPQKNQPLQKSSEELGLFIILSKPFDDEKKNRSFWLNQLPE